jgi:hypothetical protein
MVFRLLAIDFAILMRSRTAVHPICMTGRILNRNSAFSAPDPNRYQALWNILESNGEDVKHLLDISFLSTAGLTIDARGATPPVSALSLAGKPS